MRACLHLLTQESEESVFYQILNEDIELNNATTFEYSQYHLNLLDDNAKRIFNNSGLELGNYSILDSRTEENDYWGEIRYIFLRAI